MSDSGAPQDPTQPAPDRRPAPGADAPYQPRVMPGGGTTPPPAQPTVTPRVGGGAHAAAAGQGFPATTPAEPHAHHAPAHAAPVGAGGGPVGPQTAASAPAGEPPAGDDAEGSRRPRWLLPVAIGAGVLVVGGVVTGIVLAGRGDDSATPVEATTIRLPSPTPSVEPVAREADTPFAQVLPASVLQYALASSGADDTWTGAGALEAYSEEFSDGGTGTFTVQSGQWASNAEAKAFAETLAAELPTDTAQGAGTEDRVDAQAEATDGASLPGKSAPAKPSDDALPQSGTVRVGDDAIVGTFTAADLGDGTGVVVWYNRTAVFRAEGPVADVLDFYRAFPV
ncbi:hypothetical protein [Cellulomonas palmilytica]|uniref:hypothetical protein n=1 Tax=Cellulomonas palmilytica TaxID=2608402 RepID=UPI001F3F118C|nr:hypothetical protein [Cellulomonas palmilytica]UJP40856.1 hypothetical protein F1D97_05075 [Cellulomonas palmilytica]